MDRGVALKKVVERGGTWWSVVDKCGRCTMLWRPVESHDLIIPLNIRLKNHCLFLILFVSLGTQESSK